MRAETLSILQTVYALPLREPLQPFDADTLNIIVAAAQKGGGNAYDAAAAFMTMHMKHRLEWALKYQEPPCDDVALFLPMLRTGLARSRDRMNFYAYHDTAVREVEALKAEIDRRDRPN
ncbi:MAG: hypothetical protein BGO51_12900 [Rhodospirillales bacterium 69-11]|nr:MAG: hypothetical protein BGO51_12900 [Rhodospirillales bacterium 69-11]